MSIFDVNGNSIQNIYDVDGNIIQTCDTSVGYVTYPEYKTVNDNSYRLVWHDEFENKDLEKSFWNDVQFISLRTNRYQGWSDYYLDDSKLHLRIQKDAPNSYGSDISGDVAQSLVMTGEHNKLHITSPYHHDINPFWGLLTQEGYYECRFKVFKGSGTHTSWWCIGIQDGEETNYPRAEIDITEILGNATTNLPHGQHKQTDDSCTESYTTTATSVDFATDFHTVGFLWENGVMKWYLDGNLVDTKTINTPQYPVIHILAAYKRISGTGWTGDADPTLDTVEFQVDYLRIYKKATSVSDSEVSVSSYTPISINGSSATMTIDDDRGCPICFPSYVYVNWSDGSRTEHWVKWDAVKSTYATKMTNHTDFEWSGYVYGLGTTISASITY